jgi:hypothetical protein
MCRDQQDSPSRTCAFFALDLGEALVLEMHVQVLCGEQECVDDTVPGDDDVVLTDRLADEVPLAGGGRRQVKRGDLSRDLPIRLFRVGLLVPVSCGSR